MQPALSSPPSPARCCAARGADGLGGALFLGEEGLALPALISPWPEACPTGARQCGLQLNTWVPSSSPRLAGT